MSDATTPQTLVELGSIPDLGALYRAQVPKLAARRPRAGEPTTGFAVRGASVDPAHLAAYCRATGFRLRDAAPVLYPYVLSFPLAIKVMDHPDFPFKPLGAVHISNRIIQARPLRVGEPFDLEVYAQNLRPHRKGLLIDMRTRVRAGSAGTAGGQTVWEQTSTFLSLGSAEVPGRAEESGRALGTPAFDPAASPAAVLRFDQAGTSAYAAASGDKNPIHVSRLGARAFGFKSTIAHGMYSLARLVAFREGHLPAALEVAADFYRPLTLPGTANLYEGASASPGWAAGAGGAGTELTLRAAKDPGKLHVAARIG